MLHATALQKAMESCLEDPFCPFEVALQATPVFQKVGKRGREEEEATAGPCANLCAEREEGRSCRRNENARREGETTTTAITTVEYAKVRNSTNNNANEGN